jgi:hypothetical protein
MSLSGNFEQLQLDGEVLTVAGSSSGLDGGELVSRNVAVHQDGNVVQGPANSDPLKWIADPLVAPGFEAGEALALGCETYFDENVGDLPAFVTFTWSQIVTIAGK